MDMGRRKKEEIKAFGPRDDRFELNEELASGVQGEVFVCTRRKTGVKHATKRIDIGSLELRRTAKKTQTNLTREIRIMRELHHERIVNLIEAFWEGNVCFIVMDFCRGGTLHDKLVPGSGLGDEEAAIHISRQLLEGIGYMHSHGVIHRDLKPANVLLTHKIVRKEGFYDIKIADFGLSRILNEPGGDSKSMTKVGTPAFAAPEIFLATYDNKADFWSFGCILFTMFCGEYPFDEMPEHIKNPRTAKAEILPCPAWTRISVNGKDICMGLLRPDPSQRLDLHGCLRHQFFKGAEQNEDFFQMDKLMEHQVSAKPSDNFPSREDPIVQSKSCGCCDGLLVALGLRLSPSLSAELALVEFHTLDAGLPMRRAVSKERSPSFHSGCAVVSSIRGWSGMAVDSIEMRYANGECRNHGDEGGTEYKEWKLGPDELIIGVTQERQGDGYLGNAVVFFTSTGRSIAVRGSAAAKKRRFIAPAGTQITGLMFESSRLMGVMIEKTKTSRPWEPMKGIISNIWGSVGYAVDGVQFTLRDGEERLYGREDGGDYQKSWDLAVDETVRIVEQGWKDAFLGYSLSFYTSAGNVLSLRGISATQSLRFMCSHGEQICGLEFEAGKLSHVNTCKGDGDMSKCTRHRMKTDLMTEGISVGGLSGAASEVRTGNASPPRDSEPSSPTSPTANGRRQPW